MQVQTGLEMEGQRVCEGEQQLVDFLNVSIVKEDPENVSQ
jgi:hypothetical protein